MVGEKIRGVVAQSGGPTVVINRTLVGIIFEAYKHTDKIQELWGSLKGPEGVVDHKFVDLYKVSRENLMLVANTPGAALYSSRKKIGEQIDPEKFFDGLKKNNVRYFFYIGGNDSANNCYTVLRLAQDTRYEMRIFHIPKTIDNDLLENDHCPGYGSAARFVTCALMGDNEDTASLPGVKIDVIMGRDAGWLTAASSLARMKEGDAPHLIYVPERGLTLDKFVGDVESAYKQLDRAVVAVSEGIRDNDGVLWAEKIAKVLDVDPYGHKQLSGTGTLGDFLANQVKETLRIKRVRADTFGYLQRSFPECVSNQDAEEAEAVGQEGVILATTSDRQSGSITIQRKGKIIGYGYELGCAELENVAKGTRPLDPKYISNNGNDIMPEFKDYGIPLIGKGMPRPVELEKHMVE